MDIANWLVKIYASEYFIFTAFFAIVFSTSVGHFIDRAMGQASFGVWPNAIVVLFAIAVASSIQDKGIAMMIPDNAVRISTMSVIIGCGVLIMIASLRRWLVDNA